MPASLLSLPMFGEGRGWGRHMALRRVQTRMSIRFLLPTHRAQTQRLAGERGFSGV
jgi:hypothetical protein